MAGEVVAFVTCPQEKAEGIATTLVEDQLAACVNIVGQVRSIYRWEGTLNKDTESLLIIKTNLMVWDPFVEKVSEIHPYDTPEIICLAIEEGSKPYLDWLNHSINER
jgi:periplasmic divalent cation tolerance protein